MTDESVDDVIPEPPQSVRDELRRIADRDGVLTVDTVLAEAKAKTNPLHDHLEWDDAVAGERFRRTQVESMIRRYRIVVEVAPERMVRVRAFTAMGETGTYVDTIEALRSEGRELVLAQAQRDFDRFRVKYQALIDLDQFLAAQIAA